MAIGNMATGRVFYKTVKVGGNTYYIGDYVFDANDLTNQAIREMTNLAVSYDNGTLTITFDPITNTDLLDAIDNEDTYMRVQLVQHSPSGDIPSKSIKGKVIKRPMVLPKNAFPTKTQQDKDKNFIRPRSHQPSYYGKTWLNLSRMQLINGSATLSGFERCSTGFGNQTTINDYEHKVQYVQRIAVEIYCPCLHRSGKDPFYYERQGVYKLSNIVYYLLEN